MEKIVNIAIAGVTEKNIESLFRYVVEKYPGGTFFVYKSLDEVFERIGRIKYQRIILSDSFSKDDVGDVEDYVKEEGLSIEVEIYNQ